MLGMFWGHQDPHLFIDTNKKCDTLRLALPRSYMERRKHTIMNSNHVVPVHKYDISYAINNIHSVPVILLDWHGWGCSLRETVKVKIRSRRSKINFMSCLLIVSSCFDIEYTDSILEYLWRMYIFVFFCPRIPERSNTVHRSWFIFYDFFLLLLP